MERFSTNVKKSFNCYREVFDPNSKAFKSPYKPIFTFAISDLLGTVMKKDPNLLPDRFFNMYGNMFVVGYMPNFTDPPYFKKLPDDDFVGYGAVHYPDHIGMIVIDIRYVTETWVKITKDEFETTGEFEELPDVYEDRLVYVRKELLQFG